MRADASERTKAHTCGKATTTKVCFAPIADDPKQLLLCRMSASKWTAGAVVAVVPALWLYLLLWPMPKLPIDAANGAYANPCCEPIILRDGTMLFGNHEVRYMNMRSNPSAASPRRVAPNIRP